MLRLRAITHVILVCAAIGLRAPAQTDPRLRIDARWRRAPVMFEEDLFNANLARARSGIFDARAEPVLRAAEAFTKDVFTFSTLVLRQAATYSQYFDGPTLKCSANYDTLLVEWDGDGPAGPMKLTLEDTPVHSIYVLRLRGRPIVSRDDLTAFLRGVIADEKPPLDIELSKWQFNAAPGPGVPVFDGTASRSPNSLLREIWIAGDLRGQEAYLYFRITKDFAEKYYHLPHLVPERFPSLAELARGWSFNRILSEIGGTNCPEQRDHVLLTELVQRDLTSDRFLQLLSQTNLVTSDALARRVGAVMLAIDEKKRPAVLRSYLEEALQVYDAMGRLGDKAGDALIGAARHPCAPEIEPIALKNLETTHIAEVMNYLGECSSSDKAVHALEVLRLNGEAEAERERVLRAIRRRRTTGPENQ